MKKRGRMVEIHAPKLRNEIRIELASEMANMATEALAEELGITVTIEQDNGDISYSEEAQELFNAFYDKAYAIVDEIFGPEKPRRGE
jgi:hypothetical protein